jgi:hypothetical protein
MADEVAELAFHAVNVTADFNTTLHVAGCSASATGTLQDANGTRSLDANIVFASGDCAGRVKISGSESLSASWTLASASRSVSVTTDLTRTDADGRSISISSLDPSQPTASLSANGLPAIGSVTLVATLNQHRQAKAAGGSVIFDQNITTDPNGLTITNAYTLLHPATRTINSGSVAVHHNLAKFTAKNTFADVARDASAASACDCPQSGTLTQEITKDDGSGSYTRVYTFTGCGEATVTTSASTLKGTADGSATVTWNNCTH